jgi:hypothetical protein
MQTNLSFSPWIGFERSKAWLPCFLPSLCADAADGSRVLRRRRMTDGGSLNSIVYIVI